jgi:DNA-directed RNA polymerase subunit M/transcription elongation factor TFIIS
MAIWLIPKKLYQDPVVPYTTRFALVDLLMRTCQYTYERAQRAERQLYEDTKRNAAEYLLRFNTLFVESQGRARGGGTDIHKRVREAREYRLQQQKALEQERRGAEYDKETEYAIATCQRCSSTDIEIQLKQTRSGDEAMTCFFKCRACDKQWRENNH